MTDNSPQIDKLEDGFSDAVWVDVLRSVDQTYQQLVDHQIELERRNAELESMRAFLTSVLGAMSDVLIVCGPEGQILDVNHAFQELTGNDKATVTGTSVLDLFDPVDRDGVRDALANLKAGRVVDHAERNLLTQFGRVPLELGAAARQDQRNRHVGAVLLGRPVGELRRALEQMASSHKALKDAQSQLVHSEKLASLGRLLAGVAHELNNPISFVYANAHALERYAERFETYFARVDAGAERSELIALRGQLKLDRAVKNMRSAVTGALEGAERVRDIVEDLRRLSAEGTGEIEPFDLAATTRNAALWVIKGRASSMPLEIEAPDQLIVVGRGGHIQQVVMNLVQNALDAMEGQSEPGIDIRLFARGGEAVLEVADRGPGVPPETAMRIFDPFYTTKPVGKGTGLGLSISYKIVLENKGTLKVAKRDGGGAVFTLALPLAS